MSRGRNATPDAAGLAVDDPAIGPVTVLRSGRARRISLRLDPQSGAAVLVLPVRAPLSQGMAFVRAKSDWLRARAAALPKRVRFVDGAELPLLGQPHRLRHDPVSRRGVWAEDGIIHVCGQPEHFARRVGDWLKDQARREIGQRAEAMAARIGKPVGRIRLSDPRSRWGSCNSRGTLAFSWRLILAPPEVLDYVVAHEVAHLAEMNHSPAFWRLVASLGVDGAAGRTWLKRHGPELQRYG
jgi:predicted metal-dependent hydrolase